MNDKMGKKIAIYKIQKLNIKCITCNWAPCAWDMGSGYN